MTRRRQVRVGVPTPNAIAKHWMERTEFPGCEGAGRMSDHPDMPCCFACGWRYEGCHGGPFRGLERAHVIPHANGGSDSDPSNYALLCLRCHRESPDTDDVEYFWRWVVQYPEDRSELGKWGRVMEAVTASVSDQDISVFSEGPSITAEQVKMAIEQAGRELRPGFHAGEFSEGTRVKLILRSIQILTVRYAEPLGAEVDAGRQALD